MGGVGLNHSNLEGNCFVRETHLTFPPFPCGYSSLAYTGDLRIPFLTISRGRLFSLISSPPSLISADNHSTPMTYTTVCKKLFILLLNGICKIALIYKSVYVMLYNIHYTILSYLLSYLKNSLYLNFLAYHTVCYVNQ